MRADDEPAQGDPQQVTVVFSQPLVQPGTPEAEAAGCRCSFESNLRAGFLSAERGHEDEVIVVIHKDCPLHRIVPGPGPIDDSLGQL